ncbi:uncharacterized protein LOC143298175 [Babylonia areolata]|uniref:uncharacterized protein LOC143298175 n=1 Tax=Babylonia areolata TaxID=304850 RepID=UPI003FD2D2F9
MPKPPADVMSKPPVSLITKSPDMGKVERIVKMDYSVTYRENDKLDVHLDEQLVSLKRSAFRKKTEKEEELETARADADKIRKLKEAVNNRQEEEPALTILCQTLAPWGGKSPDVPYRRRISTATGGFARRASSARHARERGEGEEEDDEEEKGPLPDVKTMSLTERRLAKERDQFSAKNLFNVRRRASSAYTAPEPPARRRGGDVSPDSSRTATPTSALPTTPSPSTRQGRPRTSPAAYSGGRSALRTHSYMRPTTASVSRLASRPPGEGGGEFPRHPRRPRSRRELQKLVELKVDPFEDEVAHRPDSWTSAGDRHQDLLHSLQKTQARLQQRVSAFLAAMDSFNRRDTKSALDSILEGN